jgi:Trypsin-like peptidase domain
LSLVATTCGSSTLTRDCSKSKKLLLAHLEQPSDIDSCTFFAGECRRKKVAASRGRFVATSFAGVDPSTDLAVLKVESDELSIPRFGDTAQLRVGHLVLAVGRGAQRGINATLGMIGVLSGAWRTGAAD